MKKLLLMIMIICMACINIHVYANEEVDQLDVAFKKYKEESLYDYKWFGSEPESIYDLKFYSDYKTLNGNRFIIIEPSGMLFPSITEYPVGNEIFTFNYTNYTTLFLVFDGNDLYHVEDAYEKNIINDWDLREYALVKNHRKATFSDLIKKEWYYLMVEKSIFDQSMIATGNGLFEPDTPISRGMVATVLYRMEGNPKTQFNNKFSDVTNPQLWYSNAIAWAANSNVVSGHEDGTFKPDDSIIRQDLMVMMYNYYHKEKDIEQIQEINIQNTKDFKEIDDYAKNAVNWCYENGIISGSVQKDGIYIYPKNTATRAEFAKMSLLLSDLLKAE